MLDLLFTLSSGELRFYAPDGKWLKEKTYQVSFYFSAESAIFNPWKNQLVAAMSNKIAFVTVKPVETEHWIKQNPVYDEELDKGHEFLVTPGAVVVVILW